MNDNQPRFMRDIMNTISAFREAREMDVEFNRISSLKPPVLLEKIVRPSLGETK